MKFLKRVICLALVLLTIGALCACGNTSPDSKSSKTPEEKVRSAVQVKSVTQYRGLSIGGNELKSSDATITNVKKVTDTEYIVSGKIVMTDIYGTKWNNTFDCEVIDMGSSWMAGSFEYTSKNWTKG